MSQWRSVISVVALLLVSATGVGAVGVTLKGSPASIERQNLVARELGFTFVETPEQVPALVDAEELIAIPGNADYEVLPGVSHKVARPEMRLFIERLAAQYHAGTGEPLVVTSLTRAASSQPRNAHPLSVHPTGMAVDLRVSATANSRAWLESVLLRLERQGVLDVTLERYPPHYHIALFPKAYMDYIESLIGAEAVAEALKFAPPLVEPEVESPSLARRAPGKVARTLVAAATRPDAGSQPWHLLAAVPLLILPAVVLWKRARRVRQESIEGVGPLVQ